MILPADDRHEKKPSWNNELQPLLLSDLKVAELLNVSRRTVWRLSAAGMLPAPVRIAGCVRWRYEDIRAWIRQLSTN